MTSPVFDEATGAKAVLGRLAQMDATAASWAAISACCASAIFAKPYPGRSTTRARPPPLSSISNKFSNRVRPGVRPVTATPFLAPTNALSIEDLPTLLLPTKAISGNGSRGVSSGVV